MSYEYCKYWVEIDKEGIMLKNKTKNCYSSNKKSQDLHVPNENVCESSNEILDSCPEKSDEWTYFYCEIVSKESHEKVTNEYKNFKSQVKNYVEEIESKVSLK